MSADDCGTECQDALERLEAFLDGELPEDSLPSISAHLAGCYPCGDRADFEQQLRAIIRRDCADRAPESLISRIEMHLDQLA